ncbi:C-3 sterol dehydrogenase, putative [Talaromyces islandicus]|uniref:C-3 sterol dehydrogenase, putative n=1 Tax=Talaromyces islandicus TaxID=28573 RepID=A0A0U1M3T2_TALIS|nr:C-3 sterol dehydrogenase, putative [Talaromyces islandicus]
MELNNILITGGCGFVGSAIARAIAEKYPRCAITIIDIAPPGSIHEVPSQAEFIKVDVTSAVEVEKAIQKVRPTTVIHTAGIVPVLAERFGRRMQSVVWKLNVDGTRIMLDVSKRLGVKAFVFTSSCCVTIDDMRLPYRNISEDWPTSQTSLIYGESKAAAERLVLEASCAQMVTCSLRPSVLTGPGDYQLLPAIHACIAKWETPWVLGDGLNYWDVTLVQNIADAHVLAAENLTSTRTAAGEAFFIQNNEPIPFRDFCLAIWAHFGHIPPFTVHVPLSLAWMAGLLSECYTWFSGTTTTLSRGSVRDACHMRYASGEKARRILGYEARLGLEQGIRLSCEDYARRLGIKLPERPSLKAKAA